jgi:WD40 repeat protein
VAQLQGHTGGIRGVAVSADGETIASSGDDGTVRLWATRSGLSRSVLEGHTAAVYGVALSSDARTVASGSLDGTVRLWDARRGVAAGILEGHTAAVYGVAISSDGRTVASASLDATVNIWDGASLSLARTLRPDRRYERMDISGLTGVTEAQRAALISLGAAERAADTSG